MHAVHRLSLNRLGNITHKTEYDSRSLRQIVFKLFHGPARSLTDNEDRSSMTKVTV